MEGLMPVLRLSEAGNIDLAKASSLVTDSMSALGLTTAELPAYLDIVAQTARSSNTDIDQMAEAYLKVGGTLRGLGVPLEESALALGMLANSGIKGSEAGTALNAVMANLTSPTGRAKQALEELGFSAFDSGGNFKGLENILFDLKDKLSGMTEEQRSTYLAMVGGKEHVKDLNALLNGLDDSYDGLTASIKDSEGALEDVAKTMQDNNKGSLTQLSSALEELGLKIYDVLKPSIAAIVETIQGFVDKLNSLSPAQQEAIVKIGLLVAAIGPVLLIIGKLVTFIGGLITAFSTISTAVAAAGGAMAIITGPIGIAIAAIAGLIAVGVALYKNWDTIKEWTSNIWEGIKNIIGGVVDKIKGIWDGMGTTAKVILTAIVTGPIGGLIAAGIAIYKNWDTIKEQAAIIWQSIADTIMGVWEAVKIGIAFVWEVIASIFESAWVVISSIVQTYINIVTAIIDVAWQLIQTVTSTVWEAISGVISTVWEGIVNFIGPIIDGIANIISTAWDTIKTVTETVFNAISEVIKTIWEGIVNFITPIVEAIANAISTAWGAIETVTTTVMDTIQTIVTTIWNGIQTTTTTVWNGISSFFSTLWGGISSIFTTTVNTISNTISTVWNGIKTTTTTVWNNIKTAIMTPINAVVDFVKIQVAKIKSFFDGLQIKLPHIKLPHFKLTGSFSLNPPKVPKLGVDWYAKGGIFNSPSIIGVGEAGQEAVLPIDRLDDLMAKAIEKVGGQVGGSGSGLTVLIENFNNHTDKDIEQLAYELEFYRQRVAFGRGRGNA